MVCDSSTSFNADQYTKKINRMLALGLAISNVILFIFLIALAIVANKNYTDRGLFVFLEIASWFLGIFSAFTLIGSTLYTSWVLINLYGTAFRSTSLEILAVACIFILSFASRSVFEWVMYFQFKTNKSQTVINMMQTMAVFMPIVWDLLPISTILILHYQNYSRKDTDRSEKLGSWVLCE